jgi:hypothetical protein
MFTFYRTNLIASLSNPYGQLKIVLSEIHEFYLRGDSRKDAAKSLASSYNNCPVDYFAKTFFFQIALVFMICI